MKAQIINVSPNALNKGKWTRHYKLSARMREQRKLIYCELCKMPTRTITGTMFVHGLGMGLAIKAEYIAKEKKKEKKRQV